MVDTVYYAGNNTALAVSDQTVHSGEIGSGEYLETTEYWLKYSINATGATTVCTGACIYGGYIVAAAAGAITMTIYDNTAASGVPVVSALSVNTANTNGVLPVGIKMDNGITVNMSGDPADNCIIVLYKVIVT